jgi:hypothetical protein
MLDLQNPHLTARKSGAPDSQTLGYINTSAHPSRGLRHALGCPTLAPCSWSGSLRWRWPDCRAGRQGERCASLGRSPALLCFALLCFALLCFVMLCFVAWGLRSLEEHPGSGVGNDSVRPHRDRSRPEHQHRHAWQQAGEVLLDHRGAHPTYSEQAPPAPTPSSG